jgi:hypothetical protein
LVFANDDEFHRNGLRHVPVSVGRPNRSYIESDWGAHLAPIRTCNYLCSSRLLGSPSLLASSTFQTNVQSLEWEVRIAVSARVNSYTVNGPHKNADVRQRLSSDPIILEVIMSISKVESFIGVAKQQIAQRDINESLS